MTLNKMVGDGTIADDWAKMLTPQHERLTQIRQFLRAERNAGHQVLPPEQNIFAAFKQPFHSVRVLVVGQDPYPTPGHANGLSFATTPQLRPIPRSLKNIYRELHDDLGIPPADHGDLTSWTTQGVMLLNRVLTVRAGSPGSHRGRGWEQFTLHAITSLVRRGTPLVAILWGNDARSLRPMLGDTPVIESPHPSPLSASRGFFGSRPFSRANQFLQAQGATPIRWDCERHSG